jgi:hypothetical protein
MTEQISSIVEEDLDTEQSAFEFAVTNAYQTFLIAGDALRGTGKPFTISDQIAYATLVISAMRTNVASEAIVDVADTILIASGKTEQLLETPSA